MKTINVEIDGVGQCELREPSIAALRDKIHLMETNSQEFLIEVLGVALHDNKGKVVPLDLVPFGAMPSLMTSLTKLLGFDEGES